MIRAIRRGRSAPRPWLGLLSAVALLLPAAAMEPEGHIRLEVGWLQADEEAGPRLLRLAIRSHVPLDETTLTVSTPVAIAVQPRTGQKPFVPVQAGKDRRAMRSELLRLPAAVLSTADFEIDASPDGLGTLEFVVEGRDPNGRRIRSAVGFAVSEPGPRGVRRLGAVEFPATILESNGAR